MTRLATIARRHRFGHALLFAVAVCLLVGTAAVDPLLTRSFSHSLVAFHAEAQGAAGNQVVVSSGGTALKSISTIKASADQRLKAVTSTPTESTSVAVASEKTKDEARVQYTKDACRHVKLVRGRCPTGRNEVMLSKATMASSTLLHVGAALPITNVATGIVGDPKLLPHKTMRVVGVFTMSTTDPFWGGLDVASYSAPQPGSPPAPSSYWLTGAATFTGKPPTTPMPKNADAPASVSWLGITNVVNFPVVASRLGPSSLNTAVDGVHALEHRLGDQTDVFETLTQIHAQTHNDVDQVGKILPFLLVQLGVVLLILLVQVTTYFATARRGEAAVLKMRGNGTAGVVRFGAEEFLPPYLVGAVGGIVLAYAVDWLVRHLWLPGNVGTAWNWLSLLAAVGMAVLVALVWFVCWRGMARESISALLRKRPTRRRGVRISTPAAVLGALCLVGVVLTATKSLTGAPVQVTPVLLAGFVAIVVGVLLPPVAAWCVRRLLVRRRSAAALAIAQLGRRAGVVTAITTLIITSALLTLSVSMFARGADNRAARTAADLGARAVVQLTPGVTAVSTETMEQAINSVDPKHRVFTPSVVINSSTSQSNATMGVIPEDMQRIGSTTGLKEPIPWSELKGGSPDDPPTIVGSWTTNVAVGQELSGPTMADVDGQFKVVAAPPYIPGVGARTVVVDLRNMLKVGSRSDNLSYQVFSATEDPKQLAKLKAAALKKGFASVQWQTATETRAGYDATATAWAMNLSIVVSVLSLLAALTSVVLVAVASRADRQRDLRALLTGGVSRRVVRRATVGEFVLLALIGGIIGAATAPFAAWLTGRTMLWWSTPPPQPVTVIGFQWPMGMSGAITLIVLLLVVAMLFGVRLARTADVEGRRAAA